MLFVKPGGTGEIETRYVIDEAMEKAVRAEVERVLLERGTIITNEEAAFVRCLKGRCEETIKQVYSMAVYGTMVTLGAIIVLGIREWVK